MLLRPLLLNLAEALESAGEARLADDARAAAAAGDEALSLYLCSNELWGGAGSIADQAGVADQRSPQRRRIEQALLALGHAQTDAGLVNARTAMWMSAFEQWSERGI